MEITAFRFLRYYICLLTYKSFLAFTDTLALSQVRFL